MATSVVEKKPAYALESVDKALQLIEVLRDSGPLRLVDAAKELGVSPSSAHRLLSMLVYRGFAVQGDRRAYQAGPSLGEPPLVEIDVPVLKQRSRVHLQALAGRTERPAAMMILSGRNSRVILVSPGSDSGLAYGRQGAVIPAERTCGGRALLAELSEQQLLARYQASDSEAGQRLLPLIDELRRVRRAGFAIDQQQGIYSVGTTVRQQGRAIAAIAASFSAVRSGSAMPREIFDEVFAARAAIERELAAQPIDPPRSH